MSRSESEVRMAVASDDANGDAPLVSEAVQEPLRNGDVTTALVCTQVVNRGPAGVRRSVDARLRAAQ